MFYHFKLRSSLHYYLLISGMIWALASCTDEQQKSTDKGKPDMEQDSPVRASGESRREVIMPSPVEIAQIIERTGIQYSEGIINPISNLSKYNTTFSKSVNLGVYGADLGLIISFGQTQEALQYFNTVKDLAKELDIYGIVAQSTVERIENNLNDKDTLLSIVTSTFNKADIDLKESKRDAVSALVLAGGWIEALYLATELASEESNAEINARIGEQKLSLETLISLLDMYKEDQAEEYLQLINDLKNLKSSFDKVDIRVEKSEPITKESEGITIINSKSNVNISNEVLNEISGKISTIRNKIIS